MKRTRWAGRIVKGLAALAAGSYLPGSSCASDVRDQLTSAGLDFVRESATQVLAELIPVGDLVAQE
jgi:hypothetical protein